MKRNILIFCCTFAIIIAGYSQESDKFKKRFLQELASGEVEEGCKIVVFVLDLAANAACFVPEPTVSKVACAAAKIINTSRVSGIDPNTPSSIINEAGVRVCQLTYTSSKVGIEYTFEFAKNQTEEVKKTWGWLNSLEGSLQFINYISN